MLYPHFYYDSIFQIPYDQLYAKGVRGLIYDIDNTLACHADKLPPENVVALIERLHKMGFQVALFSNNSARRLRTFNETMKLPGVSRAGKPFTAALRRLMGEMDITAQQTVIIGDQLFADVWCGLRAGVTTILVKPISDKEVITVRAKRGLERWMLKRYQSQ